MSHTDLPSEPPQPSPAAKPRRDRSPEARRAARRKKAERETRVIALLNCGVSIAEIARRERVTERRIRMMAQEILNKRAPRAPAEYVALQVNRLNEALIVATSAMSNANLDAIDRVVKIVRELDRYHGLAADGLGAETNGPRRLRAAGTLPLALASPEAKAVATP